jgi:oxygen-independent coproporphyrinogen-3 oxidase
MAGLYLHIPFCRKKCVYCDFYFSTSFEGYRDKLIKTIANEIMFRSWELEEEVKSLYFGGGTPSVLKQKEFELLFDALHKAYDLGALRESTIEVNPEDINPENLRVWRSYGFNRLSIGLQSTSERTLEWMNRGHGVEQVWKGIELSLQYGFSSLGIDLIYGLPKMTENDWEEQLQKIVQLPIQHLSAYCLTVEDKTALNKQVASKKVILPAEERIVHQYRALCAIMKQAGYDHYEISNFCTPGNPSLHNSSYWNKTSYLGFGPSAHSFTKNTRRWNIANNQKYIAKAPEQENWFDKEELSRQDHWNELFLTGFRSKKGVLKTELRNLGGLTTQETALMEEKKSRMLVYENEESFYLSEASWLLADGLASEFFRINE